MKRQIISTQAKIYCMNVFAQILVGSKNNSPSSLMALRSGRSVALEGMASP